MKEEVVEFGKYYLTSVAGKVLSLYIIPSVLFGLTYYDEVSLYYLKCAVICLTLCNFFNQVLFSPRYKKQPVRLLKKYALALPLGMVLYGYVCAALGANPFVNPMALVLLSALLCIMVFVNAYLYSENFYEALYFCLRMDLEFFHGYNPDRYIQLYNVVSYWCINVLAWFMSTFYVYDWFKTPYPYATVDGAIWGAFVGDVLGLLIVGVYIWKNKESKQV